MLTYFRAIHHNYHQRPKLCDLENRSHNLRMPLLALAVGLSSRLLYNLAFLGRYLAYHSHGSVAFVGKPSISSGGFAHGHGAISGRRWTFDTRAFDVYWSPHVSSLSMNGDVGELVVYPTDANEPVWRGALGGVLGAGSAQTAHDAPHAPH